MLFFLAAKARLEANGKSLEEEWEANKIFKMKKKQADEERNQKILNTMRQMLLTQEQEDIVNRQKKYNAGMKYQEELDRQLAEARQRSFDSMKSKL